MKFKNKVLLVTGGNFGIGRGIARKFAAEGAHVAIVARNENRSKEVVTEIVEEGLSAKSFQADVSNEDSVTNMIDEVVKNFGQIDILQNSESHLHTSRHLNHPS